MPRERPSGSRKGLRDEQSALEAVAREFSAAWQPRRGSAGAWLTLAGKRIAVDLATFRLRGISPDDAPRLRLRFDKVATRVTEGLQAALAEAVPPAVTVVLTITAPIRLASKTAAALEDRIRTLLGRQLPARDVTDTIHGNAVRIRFLKHRRQRAPKFVGLVHNTGSDPARLLEMTGALIALIGAPRPPAKPARGRWLVLITGGGISQLEAYRAIGSQLHLPAAFDKVLMVFADGRVGALAE